MTRNGLGSTQRRTREGLQKRQNMPECVRTLIDRHKKDSLRRGRDATRRSITLTTHILNIKRLGHILTKIVTKTLPGPLATSTWASHIDITTQVTNNREPKTAQRPNGIKAVKSDMKMHSTTSLKLRDSNKIKAAPLATTKTDESGQKADK